VRNYPHWERYIGHEGFKGPDTHQTGVPQGSRLLHLQQGCHTHHTSPMSQYTLRQANSGATQHRNASPAVPAMQSFKNFLIPGAIPVVTAAAGTGSSACWSCMAGFAYDTTPTEEAVYKRQIASRLRGKEGRVGVWLWLILGCYVGKSPSRAGNHHSTHKNKGLGLLVTL
jgi:hypothetical protein